MERSGGYGDTQKMSGHATVKGIVTVDSGSYPDHDSSKREISKLAGLRVHCEL
jgi:hypothetical protein